ncbi:MAG TPA: arginine N-succinyltransferase [Opitutaceae bacterium]|nr:arginine N-succinyltransferase [Opitutaceae bacterium]
MLVLRPIREGDLPGLVALARSTGGGLTSLPADEAFLGGRITDSLRAFHPGIRRPGGEHYLFALEDTADAGIVGVSGIAARVGGFDPWYSYQIRPERHVHAPLRVDKEIPVLHLRQEHRGPTELGSLFLRADRRRHGGGRLLSLARLLFLAAFPARFTETVIAEMRGFVDDQDKSPFWEAVGRHFFEFDFYAADLLCGLGQKEFIADLMPRHPIYVPLLPAEVQAAIGRVHPQTEPALALLHGEGFRRTDEVDIFDAGPQLRAPVREIRAVRQARAARVRAATAPAPAAAPDRIVANGLLEYRAALGGVREHDDGSVSLDRALAAALEVEAGDQVWLTPLR